MTDAPVLASQLVSTQWLADHLGADGLVIADASVASFLRPDGRVGYLSGHEQYLLEGHIPGAVFADLIEEFSDPEGSYPFTRPDTARFEAAAGALGVDNDTTLVLYDTAVGQWASRVWWLFRAFGYDRVAVLDGGLTKWKAEGRELELGHVEPTPAVFTAVERPELWVEKADVEAVVRGEREAALVCATPPKEYSGEFVTRARGGHIPGSSSVPAGFLVDRDSNAVLDPEALREKLAPALGAPQIITYCGGGIAATAAALALTLVGERSVAVYDGSLNEWAADPEAPLITG
ncbi:sulfurtransferase [Protaetiibacter larvae]|uniref:sulfurtransferase n=1 Tax=Protaetiibacter larvae TaxID=2592654 RepID=UPI00143D3517|nr:sulfurtransferase [Protaetiibacter larvae]